MTKTVALEYAAKGITVNTVPPFTVDTPMLREAQRAKKLPPSEVLAKASELGPRLTVVFADDFVGAAQVVATDPGRDLALVRVPADFTDRAGAS